MTVPHSALLLPVIKPFYRKAEAARLLSVSMRTLDTLLAEGTLPKRKIKGLVLITWDAIRRFYEAEEGPDAMYFKVTLPPPTIPLTHLRKNRQVKGLKQSPNP